jgi:hypothetical protein
VERLLAHPATFAAPPAQRLSVSLRARLVVERPPALRARPAVTKSAARKIRFVSRAAARPRKPAPQLNSFRLEGPSESRRPSPPPSPAALL